MGGISNVTLNGVALWALLVWSVLICLNAASVGSCSGMCRAAGSVCLCIYVALVLSTLERGGRGVLRRQNGWAYEKAEPLPN